MIQSRVVVSSSIQPSSSSSLVANHHHHQQQQQTIPLPSSSPKLQRSFHITNHNHHHHNNATNSMSHTSKHHHRHSNTTTTSSSSSYTTFITISFCIIMLTVSVIQLFISSLSIQLFNEEDVVVTSDHTTTLLHASSSSSSSSSLNKPSSSIQQEQQSSSSSSLILSHPPQSYIRQSSISNTNDDHTKWLLDTAPTDTIQQELQQHPSDIIPPSIINPPNHNDRPIYLPIPIINSVVPSNISIHHQGDVSIQTQQPQQPRIVFLNYHHSKIILRISSSIHQQPYVSLPNIQLIQQQQPYDDNDSSTNITTLMNMTTTTTTTIGGTNINDIIQEQIQQQYYDECIPMTSWQTTSYPTCHILHELDILSSSSSSSLYSSNNTYANTNNNNNNTFYDALEDDISLLSDQGSWRSVWKVQRNLFWLPSSSQSSESRLHNSTTTSIRTMNDTNDTDNIRNEMVVLKLLKFQRREFDIESYHHHRIDALAMERLTSKHHIVNIYGYCGQSVITEYASTTARLLLKNRNLSSLDRLKMGRDIVQAISDLHSIDYENATNITLTHNDLNMANAVAVQGQIKLNDFNIGIAQYWNTSSSSNNETSMCKSPVLFEAPLWKSPEEIMSSSMTKDILRTIENDLAVNNTTNINTTSLLSMIQRMKYHWIDSGPTDMYGLGNLLFQVLTKCQPWTHLEIDGPKSPMEVAILKINGQQPYVPPKYHYNTTSKVAYATLHYAIELCYQTNPKHRPTSYHLLQKMNQAIHWIETREKHIHPMELQQLFTL